MENKYYSRNSVFSAFAIGLLVGLGAYYVWDNSDTVRIIKKDAPKQEEAASDTDAATQSPNVQQDTGGYNIAVSDQPAGLSVFITSVTLTKPGWVVIHEDREGAPGNILGAKRFDAGIWEGSVELLRNTEEGGLYYAMIHTDDGDREFDYTKDMPAEGGIAVVATFNATRIR